MDIRAAMRLLAVMQAAMLALAADHQITSLPGGAQMEVESFAGVPRWRLFSHLWMHKTVNVTCPGTTDFSVYVANQPEQLAERVKQKRSAWCGLQSLVNWDSQSCVTSISPFRDTSVAVLHPKNSRVRCTFQEMEQFSPWKIGQGLLGAYLFLRAELLVSSMMFRLSTGAASFVLLSALILAFVIYRSVPNKKSMAVAMTFFGSTVMSLVRYFVGSWFPALQDVICNQWVLGYMGLSGLVGLAVTYYYDDPHNTKLNTIFMRALQLGGLALVATSTSLPEASLLAAVSLLLLRIFKHRLPRLPVFGFGPTVPARLPAAEVTTPHETRAATVGAAEHGAEEASQSVMRRSEANGDSEDGSKVAAGEVTPVVRHRQLSGTVATPQTPVSPLIQSGYIINEATGRTLQIGKATFNRLINDGYQVFFCFHRPTVDEQKGVLTPPPSGAAASSGVASQATSGRSPAVRGFGRAAAHDESPHVHRQHASPSRRDRKSLSAAAAMGLPDSPTSLPLHHRRR